MKQFLISWPLGAEWVIEREGNETVDEMVSSLYGTTDPRLMGAKITEWKGEFGGKISDSSGDEVRETESSEGTSSESIQEREPETDNSVPL